MITGYMDEDDNVVCVEGWTKAKAIGGAVSVRDTIDPREPNDATPSWFVDKCVLTTPAARGRLNWLHFSRESRRLRVVGVAENGNPFARALSLVTNA